MARLLKGRPVAEKIKEEIRHAMDIYQVQGIRPKIVTLLVEGDPASGYYAGMKKRTAEKLGIAFELIEFSPSITESRLTEVIERLNADIHVHGIMLELPLPPTLQTERIIDAISPAKDVDGLTQFNRYANVFGDPGLYPATPVACVRLLKHYGYELDGKHVTLVGCGKTVGMPLFHLLIRENATVTVCHAGTKDLAFHLKQAEIGFVAAGYAGLITTDMVHPDLILIDAGINETEDGTIQGDVSPDVQGYVSAMSPTPGGVGPVTTMQLFANLMQAVELHIQGDDLRN